MYTPPPRDFHRWVKCRLGARDQTLAAYARQLDVSYTWLRDVICGDRAGKAADKLLARVYHDLVKVEIPEYAAK